jgi:hypothetical protein
LHADDEVMDPSNPGWRTNQAVPPVGRDSSEKPKGLADMLPDWVGYGGLYAVTLIPVFILAATVTLLFVTSLK